MAPRPWTDEAGAHETGGPTRRRLLGALGASACAGLGGCVGGVLGRASTADNRRIERACTLVVDGDSTTVRVGIPAADYRTARDGIPGVSEAAAAAQSADFLDGLAARLVDLAGSPAEGLGAAQSLTASLPYATDAASTGRREYIRHPAETLVDGEGDCDDKAVLLAALLSRPAFGCRTGLVMPRHHCATLVARDDLPGEPVERALSVTLAGTTFVYVEAVGQVPPGDWAKAYGERPILAAYRDGWHVVDGEALLDAAATALDRGTAGTVTSYL